MKHKLARWILATFCAAVPTFVVSLFVVLAVQNPILSLVYMGVLALSGIVLWASKNAV